MVVLPRSMGALSGYPHRVAVRPGTVRQIIAELDAAVPGMGFGLCHETGELRPYVNIFVGTENIRDLQGLDTTVAGNTTLSVLRSVAGG